MIGRFLLLTAVLSSGSAAHGVIDQSLSTALSSRAVDACEAALLPRPKLDSDEEVIGIPLDSFRNQQGSTCWAHANFFCLEGAIQRETGLSYTLLLDNSFWFYLYRERYLRRWEKGSQLGPPGDYGDMNVMTTMGYPEELPQIMRKYGLSFHSIQQASRVPTTALASTPRAVDPGVHQGKHIRQPEEFLGMLSEARTEAEALALIDPYLNANGFFARTSEEFAAEGVIYAYEQWNREIMQLSGVSAALDMVRVPVVPSYGGEFHPSGYVVLKERRMTYLNQQVSVAQAQQMIDISLRNGNGVVADSNHAFAIIAKDAQGRYYVADGQRKQIETVENPIAMGPGRRVKHIYVTPAVIGQVLENPRYVGPLR